MIAVTESYAVMSKSARDQAVYFAKLAEQAERYDEMANHLTVSELGDELVTEERNLLPVAYKNAVDSRRASWRIVTSVEQKEKSKGSEGNAAWAKEPGAKVEKELPDIYNEILSNDDDALELFKTTLPVTLMLEQQDVQNLSPVAVAVLASQHQAHVQVTPRMLNRILNL